MAEARASEGVKGGAETRPSESRGFVFACVELRERMRTVGQGAIVMDE